jgi:glycerol kinase
VILAIDQGTTGTTCLVVDRAGNVVGSGYREIPQHYPRPGWVEHDADEIWRSVLDVGSSALRDAGVDARRLEAIGIANQRETVVAWDRSDGRPLARAIVWQDRRTAARCDELRGQGHEPLVRERTGLLLDPYFSGTKLEWLFREGGVPESAAVGTVDSWLAFKLTGEHVTDPSNASRTLLYDLRRRAWDDDLCGLLGVPAGSLPRIVPTSGVVGETAAFGGSVPVAAIVGDQQAALFGQRCIDSSTAKCTYGTGSFLLRTIGPVEPVPADGLLTTVAWEVGDRFDYAVEASMFVTGAAVQWLRDELGIIRTADETEELAASLESNDGVYFVPALTGLGSPYWDPYARGTIVGLTRGAGRAHLARAALEAIAYQTADAVGAQDVIAPDPLAELRADGGATANGWLMQFQADVLGIPVVVAALEETTALGAAYLAGFGAGCWTESELDGLATEPRRYEPRPDADPERLLAEWRRAVDRARSWAVAAPTQPLS